MQPTMSEDEIKALRTFAKFKTVTTMPTNVGFDTQPDDAISVEDDIPLDVPNGLVRVDPTTPWEQLELPDKYDALSLPMIGMRAHIHGLEARSNFDGMIVTLDVWNRDDQYFEPR